MSALHEIVNYGFLYDAVPTEEEVESCILGAVKRHQYAIDIYWSDRVMAVDYHPARKYFQATGSFGGVRADLVARQLNSKIKSGELTL